MEELSSQLADSSLARSAGAPARLRPSERATIISAAETFVKKAFVNHDPSHDWHHVHRVRLLALSLTRSPELVSVPLDMLVVELGALFHDLTDAKYSSTTTPSSVLAPYWSSLPEALVTHSQKRLVEKIVANVSWSKDQRRRSTPAHHRSAADIELNSWLETCYELQIVSDADRLDSIGSIGILRCAAYSAHIHRPLYIPPSNPEMDPVPPAEQAEGYNGSAVAHFYEKLLKIKGDRLYTDMAREEAERRQAVMRSFLREMDLEWLVGWQGAELARLAVEEEDEQGDEGERGQDGGEEA